MGPLTLWIPLRPRRRQAQPGPEGKAQGSGGSVLGAHPVPPAPSPRVGRSNGTCNQPPIDSNIPETRVLFLTVREPRDTGEKAGRVCCVGHTRARVGALSQAATGGQVWARDPPGGRTGRHQGHPPRGSSHARPLGQLRATSLAGGGDAHTPTTLLGTGLTRPGPGCPRGPRRAGRAPRPCRGARCAPRGQGPPRLPAWGQEADRGGV